MKEKTVIVKNIETNYKIFGTGKPFLILHGWGSDSGKWKSTAELLSQKNLCVIIPDLPGFGKSQQPESAWGLDNYVDWTLELTQKIPELHNQFYLLGHSFGGALAAKFAIRHNQKVIKLFLCAAAAIRKKTIKKQVLRKVSKLAKIFHFLPFYPLARKAFYKFVVGVSDYLKVDGVMKETFLKGISDDLSQKLSFIKLPVVILWGDKDDTTSVEDAHWIHKKIFHSKLVIIPGANHAPYLHVPEALSQNILSNI
ncbi:MAG: alpha/beta hydrolase [Patescibacteria group bacterium]